MIGSHRRRCESDDVDPTPLGFHGLIIHNRSTLINRNATTIIGSVTSTICGVCWPERVRQTVAWAEWPIPDSLSEELATFAYSMDDPEANTSPDDGVIGVEVRLLACRGASRRM